MFSASCLNTNNLDALNPRTPRESGKIVFKPHAFYDGFDSYEISGKDSDIIKGLLTRLVKETSSESAIRRGSLISPVDGTHILSMNGKEYFILPSFKVMGYSTPNSTSITLKKVLEKFL